MNESESIQGIPGASVRLTLDRESIGTWNWKTVYKAACTLKIARTELCQA